VVTIGNFDGVHLGHRALLAAARQLAGGGRVCAFTFNPSPRDVLAPPDKRQPLLQPIDERVDALLRCGADQVIVEPFDRAMAALEAADFCIEILDRRLGAAGVVVGWDFRFGHGRAGDAGVIERVLGLPVVQVGGVEVDGAVVSSSRVRRCLADGDVALAARLLGRPHDVAGVVEHGDQRGRTIGFPTANVGVTGGLVPANGVYAVRALVGGVVRPGVANVGTRPTFQGTGVRVEVHLFGFAGDLYGAPIRVDFIERVREERPFPGLDALVAQIRADADVARAVLAERP
jgi:riboflavin kinase/FMN adenylyltransferase